MKKIKAKSKIELVHELVELTEDVSDKNKRIDEIKTILKDKLSVDNHLCESEGVVISISEFTRDQFDQKKAMKFIPKSKIKNCYTKRKSKSIRLIDQEKFELNS